MPSRKYVGILVGSNHSNKRIQDLLIQHLNHLVDVNLLRFPTEENPPTSWYMRHFRHCTIVNAASFSGAENVRASSVFLASIDVLVAVWDGKHRMAERIIHTSKDLNIPFKVLYSDPLVELVMSDRFGSVQ